MGDAQRFHVYSTRTRNAIISDAFAAALVNKVSYETVFDLLQYLIAEKDYLPWAEALNGFFTVLDFFGNEPEIIYARVYSTRTRNAIISDAFAGALVNKVSYETVFDLLQYLTAEKDYLPWAEALNGFFIVLDFFGNEPEIIYARQFMLKLLEPIYRNSSFEHVAAEYKNDKLFFENLLEQAVIEAYCSLGSQDCIAKFKSIFDTQVLQKCQSKDAVASQCSTVAAPLRAKTYCYGVREGGESAFNKVKELYKAETVHIEKNILRD
ncbi:unnamed protein product, partial [Strongylus vulgaris]